MLLRREGSVGYHTLRDHMFFAPRKSFLAFLRWSIVSKKKLENQHPFEQGL